MNVELLYIARTKVENIPTLVNMVSRRVRQLNAGHRPMIKPDYIGQPPAEIALKEITQGLLTGKPGEAADRRTVVADNIITL